MLRAAFNNRRVGPTERKKLISAIHAIGSSLQMPDDVRKDLQLKLTGKESCAAMTVGELSAVWGRLSSLAQDAGLAKRQRKRPGRDERLPEETVTQEQLELIEELFDAIEVRPSGLMMQLCRRACGKPWAQSRADGNRIIEMLKQMRDRGWRPTKEALT